MNPDYLDGSNPTVSLFREQIRFLVDNYTPISIREFMDLMKTRQLPGSYKKPPVLLTFDDGFKNVIDHALPVLNEFGIPALFFVIGEIVENPDFLTWYVETNHLLRRTLKSRVVYKNTSLDLISPAGRKSLASLFEASFKTCRSDIDRQRMLTELAELLEVKRPKAVDLDDDLRFLGPNDLVKLGSSSLLTVASHAMTHRFLDTLTYEEQLTELQQSHRILSKHSPSYFPAVAYPGGTFNRVTLAIAKQTYKCAFATCLQASYRNTYSYPRVIIGRDTTQHLAYAISSQRLTYVVPLKRFLYNVRLCRSF